MMALIRKIVRRSSKKDESRVYYAKYLRNGRLVIPDDLPTETDLVTIHFEEVVDIRQVVDHLNAHHSDEAPLPNATVTYYRPHLEMQ